MEMIGMKAKEEFYTAEQYFTYKISFDRHPDDNVFENLPIVALVLRKVSEWDPSVVYSLQSMVCTEKELTCILTFNKHEFKDKDNNITTFDEIMKDYKVTIGVKKIE